VWSALTPLLPATSVIGCGGRSFCPCSGCYGSCCSSRAAGHHTAQRRTGCGQPGAGPLLAQARCDMGAGCGDGVVCHRKTLCINPFSVHPTVCLESANHAPLECVSCCWVLVLLLLCSKSHMCSIAGCVLAWAALAVLGGWKPPRGQHTCAGYACSGRARPGGGGGSHQLLWDGISLRLLLCPA
jgi:hypothetical protein